MSERAKRGPDAEVLIPSSDGPVSTSRGYVDVRGILTERTDQRSHYCSQSVPAISVIPTVHPLEVNANKKERVRGTNVTNLDVNSPDNHTSVTRVVEILFMMCAHF
jgi:hypothetical protein